LQRKNFSGQENVELDSAANMTNVKHMLSVTCKYAITDGVELGKGIMLKGTDILSKYGPVKET
jgi:hypothetical protein